jgi:hypothetical protein
MKYMKLYFPTGAAQRAQGNNGNSNSNSGVVYIGR